MTRMVPASAFVLAAHLLAAGVSAQQPTPPPEKPVTQPAAQRPARPLVSLDVQVVISRLQGQKQISSIPYSLAVTSNSPNAAQLNMGSDVPVPSTTFTPVTTPADAAKAPPAGKPLVSYSYRSVGTIISCRAVSHEDGRYELTLEVDDSSVFTSEQAVPPIALPGTMPVFRNFKTRNTLLLSDGQSRRFTAAADRVSGETVQVEVTLRVVK